MGLRTRDNKRRRGRVSFARRMGRHASDSGDRSRRSPVSGRARTFLLTAFFVGVFAASAGVAQDTKVVVQEGAAVAAPATAQPAPQATKAADPNAKGPQNPMGQKPGEQKPGEQKPGEQKAGEPKAGEAGSVTQRPMKPEKPGDPAELKVRPDAEGKVRFNFTGQPWPSVLEWLATISNKSLDWQELPGDYLNLTTRRAYTVDEARDLINMHLLMRGFTILQNDEVLSVANIKKLDPGMVPRVTSAELSKRSPYEYVKVSFTLDWMTAETAVEELKPMISPNGKLTPLKSTNRLEAMDAVINLREIQKLLKEEQTDTVEQLVREFSLVHARASDVEKQLSDLLGLESKGPKAPMTPEQMQQQQQQMQMQMQLRQQQQQQGGAPPGPPKEKPEVRLVVNSRKNSIIVSAPPDKMAVIDQAVRVLDVPTDGAEQLLANVNRAQVYRLAGLDPETFANHLNELGILEPTTRLQVDKRNKSVIAYASLGDHLMIKALVSKLDGSGRTFKVIQLNRLEADYVAGSIDFMMGGADKDKNQQRRPFYYYFGGDFGRQEEQSTDKFRVDADVENNKLILWANQVEMEEVMKLLAELGEIPARGVNNKTVRVLQLEPGEGTAEALERIRRAWPSISPNPLVAPALEREQGRPRGESKAKEPADRRIPTIYKRESKEKAPRETKRETPTEGSAVAAIPALLRKQISENSSQSAGGATPASKTAPEEEQDAASTAEDTTRGPAQEQGTERARDEANRQPLSGPPNLRRPRNADEGFPSAREQSSAAEPPPITISHGPNGELIISSPDTQALDLFEEMVTQLTPNRREYKVFYLKNQIAFWVAGNLEDYFDVDKKKSDDRGFRPWFYYDDFGSSNTKNDTTRRLSKRKPLKFISDSDTNSILVVGADPAQLEVIEDLIELWDRPEPADSRAARMTTVFTLKWSKAKIVGETIKDVYRDLLSSNDKALQNQDPNNQQKKRPESQNVYITNFGGEEGEEGRGTEVKFKGKLSIGIDELSNTLVVSTEGENLMNNVGKMIQSLDEAARPTLNAVRLVRTNGVTSSSDVRKAIGRALTQPAEGPKPQQPPQQPGQGQAPNQQQPGMNGNGQPNPNEGQ